MEIKRINPRQVFGRSLIINPIKGLRETRRNCSKCLLHLPENNTLKKLFYFLYGLLGIKEFCSGISDPGYTLKNTEYLQLLSKLGEKKGIVEKLNQQKKDEA